MRLLILTQAVDRRDPVLGFFHRWIEEFATQCDEVLVICLREGEHALPSNVRVYSLGKEVGTSRLTRIVRFFRYISALRNEYDAVFVHMNPEYVILGGLPWRIWKKKVALWYTHKRVDVKLRIAAWFARVIFTASKESFRLTSNKVQVMGHGIDTDFFRPDPAVVRGAWYLSVGRLMQSKRHDLAIAEAVRDGKELRIAGEGSERSVLEQVASTQGARVEFLGALSQDALRDEYRTAALLIHTSETGSLDKVVLEALACGLPVRTNDPALKFLEHEGRDYVVQRHSLSNLIPRIISQLA